MAIIMLGYMLNMYKNRTVNIAMFVGAALAFALTTWLADAISRDEGRLECHELSRQYFHLSPLVGSA